MKIDFQMFLTFLLALVVYRFIDKLLLSKVDTMFGFEEYDYERE